MSLDESGGFRHDLVIIEVPQGNHITGERGLIRPAGLFVCELDESDWRLIQGFANPFIEMSGETTSARGEELRAVFTLAIPQNCIGGLNQPLLVSQFIGKRVEKHNMCIALLECLYKCQV